MRPLTYVIPKCLLPVGGKPLVEKTIQYLQKYGIEEFVLCVAYLRKQVIDTIKDGKQLGVSIEYAESEVPLGTAGQLKTAQPYLSDTFLAMNGDILTDLNVRNLVECHRRNGGVATLAVKKYGVRIPYGYITVDEGSRVTAFKEKPTIHYLANAGMYVMEPSIFNAIPAGQQCSLETDVFSTLLSKGERINSYFEEAYWTDVGSMADFERANDQALSQPLGVSLSERDQT